MPPRSSFVLHRLAEEAIHPDYGRVPRYLTIEIASAEFVLNRRAPSKLVEKRADVLRGPLAQANGFSTQDPLDTVGRGG
jgi:hypothetical protein